MGEASQTARKTASVVPNRAAVGDRLEALVADHHAFVWRSLRRLGVSDGDIDDSSQQVFLVAHRRLAEIAPDCERAFLFQTALRVAADWRRAHRRRFEQPGIDILEIPDAAANQEQQIDSRRARALLDRVLEVMPLDLRAVFVLFELEEMTMAEIAVVADIPPGTVASRLRRARQAFHDAARKLTAAMHIRDENEGGP
jgi:RNA polymerase sigma-70 factor (ECF subfamily)